MKDKLYIDGQDAFLEYGIFVEQYAYKELIQMPQFKKIDKTVWDEEDGEEADLTSPDLDSKTFNITFCMTNNEYAEDMFDELSKGAYHDFQFKEIRKSYRLRMTSNGDFKSYIRMGKLTLSFADDFPQVPEQDYFEYGESDVKQLGYEVDGIDFSQFGSYVIDGTNDNIRKAPQVRPNLTINLAGKAGVKYDPDFVHFKPKDVALNLFIHADNIDDFWIRWNALFSLVLQPETRKFYYSEMNAEYECYYKRNAVTRFDILKNGRVWCEFQLVLTFTNSRPTSQYCLLSTEAYDWVITEDAVNPSCIIIRPRYGISLLCTEKGEYVVTEQERDRIYMNN